MAIRNLPHGSMTARTSAARPQPKARGSFDDARKAEPMGIVRIPRALNPGPNAYACAASGDCLRPEFEDGDTVVCDPDQEPQAGDFVAIWWKDGARLPYIKRLTLALPERRFWGLKGEAQFMMVYETLNPPEQFWVSLDKVHAVHKVIHRIPAAEVAQ